MDVQDKIGVDPRRGFMFRLPALALLLGFAFALMSPGSQSAANGEQPTSAHDFRFIAIDGTDLPMSQFAGKAVLLVNTASFCGFTPQYKALQNLWEEKQDLGLVVLGVPSNDFGGQEPGSAQEIKHFCTDIYSVDFPMTVKVSVKGKRAHPLYKWIADQPIKNAVPRWNFHKILIDPQGQVVEGWRSMVKPSDKNVQSALKRVLPTS